MNWLYNKKVIISGASSGIGKEVSKILIHKYNCYILGVARTESKLQDFKTELGDKSTMFDYFPLDVGNKDGWQDLINHMQNINFVPDILINNAGTMSPFESYERATEESCERIFKTNFLSVTYAVKALLPILKQSQTPAIINISSASALGCLPGVASYSASKSALKTFSEILHCELRGQVYVATIMPGFIKTNLFHSKDNAKAVIESKDEKLINSISMPVDKAARKIVRVMKRKQARSIIGMDAKLINLMYKLTPQTSGRVVGSVMKASKLKTFENIYKKENTNGNNN